MTIDTSSANDNDLEVRRPVGRPRASGRIPDGDVREQILTAAADLFIRQGFTATTTRQIATAAGLRQGSLRHYFERKKDMFHELLDRTIDPALGALEGLNTNVDPEIRLWLLLKTDCTNLAAGDQNLASLMLLPEARDTDFNDFWERREQLKDLYRSSIQAGIDSGTFSPIDPELALAATFGLVESLAWWFEPRGNVDPDSAAHHVARAALASLLADPAALDAVIAAAEAVRIDLPGGYRHA